MKTYTVYMNEGIGQGLIVDDTITDKQFSFKKGMDRFKVVAYDDVEKERMDYLVKIFNLECELNDLKQIGEIG